MAKEKTFRLNPVLNYKASQLEVLEVEFAAHRMSYQQEIGHLAHLKNHVQDKLNAMQTEQSAGRLNPQALAQHHHYINYAQGNVSKQKTQVDDVRSKMDAKRDELVKTMQDKQVLENLRERFRLQQNKELNQQENKAVDDIVTTRYNR